MNFGINLMNEEKKLKELYFYFLKIVAILVGISVFLVIIITSVFTAAYLDMGFYEREFEKYDVNNKYGIVNMEMDELVGATKEMMSYLRGDREDMIIDAIIDGEKKQVFNNVEIYHMEDVRSLFIKALEIRKIAILVILFGLIFLISERGVKNAVKISVKTSFRVIMTFNGIILAIAFISMLDFSTAFTIFHGILFENSGWLLDGNISRLINILPEGFFVDMGIRILVTYFLLNLIILAFQIGVSHGRIVASD